MGWALGAFEGGDVSGECARPDRLDIAFVEGAGSEAEEGQGAVGGDR
jgi:hypothetical protein